jgi:hypothetical protein
VKEMIIIGVLELEITYYFSNKSKIKAKNVRIKISMFYIVIGCLIKIIQSKDEKRIKWLYVFIFLVSYGEELIDDSGMGKVKGRVVDARALSLQRTKFLPTTSTFYRQRRLL